MKKGVFIIPDILCNAGGVTVSYFEWVQDLQSFFWGEDEINERLRRIMVRSFNQVMLVAQEKKLDMRTAAQVLGIQRVAEAMQCADLSKPSYSLANPACARSATWASGLDGDNS